MSDFLWGNLGAKIKRNVRLNTIPAIIGDESGNLYHPYLPDNIWVRQLYANGYGKAFPAYSPAGSSVILSIGTRVKLAQTDDHKLQIVGYDSVGASIDGTNLLAPNVPALPSGLFIGQQSIITALVTPQAIPDLTVSVKAWPIISGGLYYEFPGQAIFDLSASVPSSGNNRFVVVFLNSDFATLSSQASTARSITDLPLGAADVQECLTAAAITSIPLAVIRLYGGQTTILNTDIIHDLRQLINSTGSAGGVSGPNPTTDRAIATWNGTTGTLLRNNANAIIDANGQLILTNSAVGQLILRGLVNQRGVVYIDNAGGKSSLLQLADADAGKWEIGMTADANLALYIFSNVTGWAHLQMYPSNKQWDFRGASFTYINANSYVTPDASALAQWESTTQGLLIPRMTTTQRDAIGTPADGLVLYNSTTKLFTVRENAAWREMASLNGTETLTNKSIDASEINSGLLALARGGTHADLSAAGPGALWQITNGGNVQDVEPQIIRVKNVSGSTATANDAGYVNYDSTNGMSYNTTTTANLGGVQWCVVIVGGANNADIWVATRGQVTVKLNANCSIGNFLTLSTTAGQAAVNTLMRPEVFAIALSANSGGAGGTCTALLVTQTTYVSISNSNDIWAVASSSTTQWTGTINGVPTATSVVVTTSTGSLNTFTPSAAGQLARVRLWNTTRNTYRRVVSISGSTITTESTTDAWANTDVLTIESQTVNSGGSPFYTELDFVNNIPSVIPAMTRVIGINLFAKDTSATASGVSSLHPLETYGGSKTQTATSIPTAAPGYNGTYRQVSLISGVVTVGVIATGAATASAILRIVGCYIATP